MSAQTPGIGGVAYRFARESRTVRELAASGLVQSRPDLLESFGFGRVHVAVEESPYELAHAAAARLLEEQQVDPSSVGLLLYGGAVGMLAQRPAVDWGDARSAFATADRFKYPGARLQYELGLDRAALIGLDQLACTTLFSALRIARAFCLTEGIEHVLCVASEFFPPDAGREAIFNCTSDAAVAVLVRRHAEHNRIVAAAQVTKGYYWDCDARREEIVASYFPTSQYVIARVLDAAGWAPADVDWILPHNVSRRSWEILLSLLRLPEARLWDANIRGRGHALAGDNFINLRDALDAGAVTPGEKLLLFSFGYGAHWTALALEA